MIKRHVGEMNADDGARVITRNILGDETAPVPTVSAESIVAELLGEQPVPEIGDVKQRRARLIPRGVGEPRKTRHNDVERIAGLATVARGIGEHRDDLRKSQERIRKSVCQDDRKRIRAVSTLVNEVDAMIVDVTRAATSG